MKRYRVKNFNAKENASIVTFPDLVAKFSGGYAIPLQVREGDLVPIEVLDPEDVRKSLIVGSLHGFIRDGFVVEEDDLPNQEIKEVNQLSNIKPEEVEQPSPPLLSTETKQVVEEQKSKDTKLETSLNDLSLVKTYEDFNRLSYFLKLRYLKESQDKVLLQDIMTSTNSPQFKNNIQVRLMQI
jgi:hypothetical protein